MNTDDNPQTQPSNNVQSQTYNALEVSQPIEQKQTEQSLINLVNTMQTVDTDSEEAQLNATSMDDNNGGRIEFNEEADKADNVIIRRVENL